MAKVKKRPRPYRKPLLLIILPIFATVIWFAVGFVLIASDIVMPLPAQDTQLMPPDMYAQYEKDVAVSDFWSTIWLGGLGIIVLGGIISASIGMVDILKRRNQHRS